MGSVAIVALICAAVVSGVIQLNLASKRLGPRPATLVLAGVTAIVSVAAEIAPELLDLLRRDPIRLVAGQWWRIITPLFAQDGGWAGLVFNLVCLVSLGFVVECRWGWRVLVPVYLGTGLIGEIVAYTLIQHQGFAGNSVANLSLAGLLAITGVLTSDVRARLSGAVALVAGLFLVVTVDLHAVGFVAGILAAIPLRLIAGTKKGVTAEAITPSGS